MTFTRKNAWNDTGTFDNPDLLWYAKGVREMQTRSLDDPTSWWFFAAIHGVYINRATTPSGSLNWADIPGLPHVPTTPLPASNVVAKYWKQCQHNTWFFLPWHRGYLYAIENVLREIIQGLNGPADWALPYWNYFGSDEHTIPPAFTQEKMPDESQNPLYVTARYGPSTSGDIYVDYSKVSQKCQTSSVYTGITPDFYGGSQTGFEHSGRNPGAVEYNPHNGVHGMVGGRTAFNRGLMSDPGTAALDPIFYLHHCNIDRMWAAWNNVAKNNPTDPNWLNGPTAMADRKFYMPKPDKTQWQFTPDTVNTIGKLNYTYQNLSLGVTPLIASKNALRLLKFGLRFDAIKAVDDMKLDAKTELIGANSGAISLNTTGARTTVKLDSKGWKTVAKSLSKTSASLLMDSPTVPNIPDEVYLELEGIKGNSDANTYSVTVNQHFVGHIFLFGLAMASSDDNEHGGHGLNIVFNITKVIDDLHLNNVLDLSSLDVLIQPSSPTYENDKCSIERIRVYRKAQI